MAACTIITATVCMSIQIVYISCSFIMVVFHHTQQTLWLLLYLDKEFTQLNDIEWQVLLELITLLTLEMGV